MINFPDKELLVNVYVYVTPCERLANNESIRDMIDRDTG